jgi:hypothetical protein
MFSHNSRKALATALAGAALASAAGASGATADEYIDLRSPDAKAATTVEEPYTDLRNPDSREPQSPAATPDAQLVADEPSTPGAFDWLSAALGAAAGAGIVLVLFAAGGIRRLSGPARA